MLLPPDLLNSRIPVSYSKWSTGVPEDGFQITSQNFAMVGQFRPGSEEIAFITKIPENKVFFFKHEPNTIYDWTREFILEYTPLKMILITEGFSLIYLYLECYKNNI